MTAPSQAVEQPSALEGEGEQKAVLRTRVRRECENCGEPATKKHTFLLPNARRNSHSSAYGKDDCTWCSDHEQYSCDTCSPGNRWPQAEGYEWCSTFEVAKFPHMFLKWNEKAIDFDALTARVRELEAALKVARDYVYDYGSEASMAPVVAQIDAALANSPKESA